MALAFIIGGVIIWAERRQVDQQARVVQARRFEFAGRAQSGFGAALAVLFPGTSRSGAAIIGGMFLGLSRQVATHFSFFLAMPILFLACIKGVWDMRHLSSEISNSGVTMNLSVLA